MWDDVNETTVAEAEQLTVDGETTFTDVPQGFYCAVETTTPAGHETADPQCFEITVGTTSAGPTVELTFVEVRLHKVIVIVCHEGTNTLAESTVTNGSGERQWRSRPSPLTLGRMRSGLCALVGRPNVGKSTLLNAIVGQKVAITAAVPQTTRHAIRGVLHRDDLQIVFVDTPGMHKPRTLLGSRLNEVARDILSGVDVVVFLVDGKAGVGRGDEFVAGLLANVPGDKIAVVNKVDAYAKPRVLPQIEKVAAMGDWAEIVPISALEGDNVEVVVDLIAQRLPEGPPYFPEGQVTDQSQEQLFAELIREKAIRLMHEEVPHSIAVAIDEIGPGESDGVVAVTATLYVERESQKGIVIGKGGSVLRDIGSRARKEMQAILGARVFLDLRVKLFKEWRRDPRKLQRLGY